MITHKSVRALNGPVWIGIRITMIISLVIVIPWLVGSSWSSEASEPQDSGTYYPKRLHYGVLNAMSGIDKEDAQVAVQMNFDRIHTTYDPDFKVQLSFLNDAASAAKRIQQKKLHALSITGTDFIRLRELAKVKPLFITSKLMSSPLEPYVLITKKSLSLTELAAQDQRRLMIENNNDWDIGRIWLETVLHEKGLPKATDFFTSIQTYRKPMRLILPVFFGKAEACLVPENAFNTMVELNPQIGKRLHILLRSPGFVKNLVCIADYLSPKFVDEMSTALRDMHKSDEGRQILIIFQHQRNFQFKQEYLIETEKVFRRYQNLKHAKQ